MGRAMGSMISQDKTVFQWGVERAPMPFISFALRSGTELRGLLWYDSDHWMGLERKKKPGLWIFAGNA